MSSKSEVRVVDDGIIEIGPPFDDTETVLNALLRGLATMKGVPESELDPLYNHIDPEALHSLLEHAQRGDRYVGVEFTVDGHTVVVTSTGPIRLYRGDPVTDGVSSGSE
ncbi:HalOD1 output domain-containing protein [Halomontanus rarus]|uniref:HalOD1 output domain-containing protein n=1 Tax=Halomontanus rarus TaxID=3034020 RepID=UPI0023E7C294|nr:HalOD1 output domain-containing protein [Halovivax sp. TS33]